ncbi:MAG TPA: M20/M25/M40 family metallo-hydrolase, partial [Bacteroidetes bacterium]|nr:M20/M25/M40 family metallo-hydrolase [Bacteroidota bacterium]
LEEQVRHMRDCFERACAAHRAEGDDIPRFEEERSDDYKAVRFTEEDTPVRLALEAGRRLGWTMETKISGGGTDGSVLTHKGIPCVVLGVGMNDVHSTKENIKIADLEDAARLIATIVTLQAENAVM